jgi:hypothetical protein
VSESITPQAFYSSHSLFTDPAEMAFLLSGLPNDIASLARMVQGLLLHPFESELYQVDLTIIQRKEVNIRTVAEMLRRLHSMDNRPLSEARPPSERLVGNCRDHAVLFCALLRQVGIPARVRVGFAAYLSPTMNADHWVCEYWQPASSQAGGGRWVMVDAQIDELQRKAHNITFDTLDVPDGQFFTAGMAWQLCTDGKAKSRNFGHNLKVRGWPFMRGSLVQDLATLNKIEPLPWDLWWDLAVKSDDKLTPVDRRLLTRLARITHEVDQNFDDVLITYEADDQFGSAARSKLVLLGLLRDSDHFYGTVEEPGQQPTAAEVETGAAAAAANNNGSSANGSSNDDGSTQMAGAPIPGAVRRNGTAQPAPETRSTTAAALRPSDGARLAALGQRLKTAAGAQRLPPGSQPGRTGQRHRPRPDCGARRAAAQPEARQRDHPAQQDGGADRGQRVGQVFAGLRYLYAEGQRRYVESLSSYVRRYLDQMDKPKVDYIGGLSPAIAIEQKSVSKNPRSTVGTVTEVVDYMRVLYSRAGTQHCPRCGRAVEPSSPQMAADGLAQLPPGTRYQVIAPVARGKKGDHAALLEGMRKEGFSRARVDGEMIDLHSDKKLPKLAKTQPHTIDLVVDRLVVPAADAGEQDWKDYSVRVIDSVETAFKAAKGLLAIDLGEVKSRFC